MRCRTRMNMYEAKLSFVQSGWKRLRRWRAGGKSMRVEGRVGAGTREPAASRLAARDRFSAGG